MYSKISKYVLLSGVYFCFLFGIIIKNQSAVYYENQELLFMFLVPVCIVIFLPVSAIFKIISIAKKEEIQSYDNRKLFKLAAISLVIALIPTLRNQYYISQYDLDAVWKWSSGSDNYIVLRINTISFCTLDSNSRLSFDDVNNDGFKDLVYGKDSSQSLVYVPAKKTFTNCPIMGG